MKSDFELGLTFDDVLLSPGYSEVLPAQIDVCSPLAGSIQLKTPFLSAAMDTVTESQTAIAMAREGGIGIVHRNLSIEEQSDEVYRVKKFESGMVTHPVTVRPTDSMQAVRELMQQHNISGLPVVDGDRLVGILTSRDLRYAVDDAKTVAEVMTKDVFTAKDGTTLEEAREVLHRHRIEKLPVVDGNGKLVGLITSKDIEKAELHPFSSKDEQGRLLVGAAVGVSPDDHDRVAALVERHVDVIVVDIAHGNSKRLLDFLKTTRKKYPDLMIVAGNIATSDAVEALAKAGANAVKVGIGGGSICTTRMVSGVGVPQLTAIAKCSEMARKHGVLTIADGGVKFSGDVVKAMAAGADTVMIGSLFAGTDETPGDMILYQGRTYKSYRGMGSMGAIKRGGMGRYFPPSGVVGVQEPVPEGIEGRVPYRGSLAKNLHQLIGGLKSGMAYVGAKDLAELREKANFVRISNAGLRESHVHDVIITKEAPNYRPAFGNS